VAGLWQVYQAPTRELAETKLLELGERWGGQFAMAVRCWERAWEELATMFDYPPDIRRLMYTTNAVEGYNRQLRKLLYLVNRDITANWVTLPNWVRIRNQIGHSR